MVRIPEYSEVVADNLTNQLLQPWHHPTDLEERKKGTDTAEKGTTGPKLGFIFSETSLLSPHREFASLFVATIHHAGSECASIIYRRRRCIQFTRFCRSNRSQYFINFPEYSISVAPARSSISETEIFQKSSHRHSSRTPSCQLV